MVKYTQTIRRQQPTDCLSAFDHFIKLALKGLKFLTNMYIPPWLAKIFIFILLQVAFSKLIPRSRKGGLCKCAILFKERLFSLRNTFL